MTDKFTNILERLERAEAAIAEIGLNGGLAPLSASDVLEDCRLPTVAVAKRLGVHVRTVERWYEDAKYAKLNFPKPEIVNRRRYWWLSQLREWERMRVRDKLGSEVSPRRVARRRGGGNGDRNVDHRGGDDHGRDRDPDRR
jgi:hypothetical protein